MRTQKTPAAKSTHINIRIAPAQRDLIDQAARVRGKTRSEFILDVAARAAESALLDQQLFLLDDTNWEAFTAILDAPVRQPKTLQTLLATPAPWD
ncbi:MAG: DUF1778 domain-containing protein [bacterium]|nr:DUF1778 domain-containing protein [bacterium]